MSADPLGSYLKNHLSASAAELQLARRAASSFEGAGETDFFDEYIEAIEEDQALMKKLLRKATERKDLGFTVGRWAMENRVAAKMAQVPSREISTLLQLEGAMIGSFGRQIIWEVRKGSSGRRG